MNGVPQRARQLGNGAGKFITFLLVIGLLGAGVWLAMRDMKDKGDAPATTGPTTSVSDAPTPKTVDTEAPEPIEPLTSTPQLEAAAADGDGKAHIAFLHRHRQMAEHGAEVWIIGYIVNDEAGIHGNLRAVIIDFYRARMAARDGIFFVDRNVVPGLMQQVR